jgi:hypothetical protein
LYSCQYVLNNLFFFVRVIFYIIFHFVFLYFLNVSSIFRHLAFSFIVLLKSVLGWSGSPCMLTCCLVSCSLSTFMISHTHQNHQANELYVVSWRDLTFKIFFFCFV